MIGSAAGEPGGAHPERRRGPAQKAAILSSHASVVDLFKKVPSCVCNLANNHIMDYGVRGLRQTQDILRANGIHFMALGWMLQKQNVKCCCVARAGRSLALPLQPMNLTSARPSAARPPRDAPVGRDWKRSKDDYSNSGAKTTL